MGHHISKHVMVHVMVIVAVLWVFLFIVLCFCSFFECFSVFFIACCFFVWKVIYNYVYETCLDYVCIMLRIITVSMSYIYVSLCFCAHVYFM